MGATYFRCLNLLQIMLAWSLSPTEKQIVGVVRETKDYKDIPMKTAYQFKVFGRSLPTDGYRFTTADRCEDIDGLSHRTSLPVKVKYSFEDWVLLESSGIPFTVRDDIFQLCNDKAESTSRKMLSIRSNFEPIGYWRIFACVCLLILSALFSGLLLAYMSHSLNEITDKSMPGSKASEQERKYASQILWYRSSANYLICTFAAANTIVNVLFTMLLNQMFRNSQHEKILSYSVPCLLTLLFGEILPQSICLQYSLPIGARLRYFTRICMVIMWPVAKPLSMAIDFLLGKEAYSIYTATELKALCKLKADRTKATEQRDILNRLFDFSERTIHNIMTPIDEVFLVNLEDTIDDEMLIKITERGYTRIPVYIGHNKNNIAFVLNVKDFVGLPLNGPSCTVANIIEQLGTDSCQTMRFADANMLAQDLMQEMRKGGQHICAVIRFIQGRYKVIGMVTFEDILEELFGEIQDDTDRASNNRRSGMHEDQRTLDWFRAAAKAKAENKPSKEAPLPVERHMWIIQNVLEIVPDLASLGFRLFEMKDLLSLDKMCFARVGDLICTAGMTVIIEGCVQFENPEFSCIEIPRNSKPLVFGAKMVEDVFAKSMGRYVRSCDAPLIPVKAQHECIYFLISEKDFQLALQTLEESVKRRDQMDRAPMGLEQLFKQVDVRSRGTPQTVKKSRKTEKKKKAVGVNDKTNLLNKDEKNNIQTLSSCSRTQTSLRS